MGIPFFVNLSMMAYEEDIKNAKENGEIDSEMITCGREVYCIDDDQFKQKVKWAIKNLNDEFHEFELKIGLLSIIEVF